MAFAEETILKLVNSVLAHGVDGLGPMSSSSALADQYRADLSFTDTASRIDSCINWEAAKNFGTGFVSGMGGLITLPISIPASMYTTWFVSARLAGTIADLHGYSTNDERVRTFILLSTIGHKAREIAKTAGIQVGNRLVLNLVKTIPGKVLQDINKQVGMRLLTKAGNTGVINLAKIVPVVGGLIGGSVDAAFCMAAGKAAKSIFSPDGDLD